MTEFFSSALRNLFRKKLRSVLTVTGIAIGVSSVILIGAVGEMGKSTVVSQLNALGMNGLNVRIQNSYSNIENDSSSNLLKKSDVSACMQVNGVAAAMPLIMQYGTAQSRGMVRSVVAWGVGSRANRVISLKVKYGKMFSQSDVRHSARVCLVDDAYAKSLYHRSNITGKVITVYLGHNFHQLKVVGVVQQGSSMLYNLVGSYMPAFLYLPYTTAAALRGTNGYDEIAVTMAPGANLNTAGKRIASRLNQLHSVSGKYVVDNMLQQKRNFSGLLASVAMILSAIGGISLVVAGLSIMTVMMVSVNERTREIGIKKAIGASKKVILFEFLWEALLLSLLGGISGILFGYAAAAAACFFMKFTLSVPLFTILGAFGFALIMGMVFGVYPAVMAARLKPVIALRHE